MGCVQLGTGCLLATAASKDLSATELGLLALLEPILGPVWVWVLMGEHPGPRDARGRPGRSRRGDRERSVRGMASRRSAGCRAITRIERLSYDSRHVDPPTRVS